MSARGNLLQIVTLTGVAMVSIGWNNASFGGPPMTDIPKSKSSPQAVFNKKMTDIERNVAASKKRMDQARVNDDRLAARYGIDISLFSANDDEMKASAAAKRKNGDRAGAIEDEWLRSIIALRRSNAIIYAMPDGPERDRKQAEFRREIEGLRKAQGLGDEGIKRILGNTDADNAAALNRAFLDHIPQLSIGAMADRRQMCAQGRAPEVIASIEAKEGRGSHPTAPIYCQAVIQESLRKKWPLALYTKMALEQSGKSDPADIGNDDNRISQNVRAAANTGKTSYPHLQGGERELPCPLALDAGAVAGAVMARDGDKLRISLSKQDISAIAQACYDPKVKEPTPAMKVIGESIVKAGNPNGAVFGLSLNLAGLLAGEALGHLTVQEANSPLPTPPATQGVKPAPRGKQESQAGEDEPATRVLRSVSR